MEHTVRHRPYYICILWQNIDETINFLSITYMHVTPGRTGMPQFYGTWTGLCDRRVLIALGSLPDIRSHSKVLPPPKVITIRFQ